MLYTCLATSRIMLRFIIYEYKFKMQTSGFTKTVERLLLEKKTALLLSK